MADDEAALEARNLAIAFLQYVGMGQRKHGADYLGIVLASVLWELVTNTKQEEICRQIFLDIAYSPAILEKPTVN